MEEQNLELKLTEFFKAEVAAVEPEDWWNEVVSRLGAAAPSASVWERLRALLSHAAWRVALAAAVIVVGAVVLWRSVFAPISQPASSQVDFIKLDGITYIAHFHSDPLLEADLSLFGEIKHRVKNIQQGYKLRDGDAAFLDSGTPVYSIAGYAPTFRIAAMREQKWFIYEADTNPKATKGSDLLDIGGKVESIGINSYVDGSELASITDEATVTELVNMVLDAPVDQSVLRGGSDQYFLEFRLKDGTSTTRAYWLDSDQLSRGIKAPGEFGEAIRTALGEDQY